MSNKLLHTKLSKKSPSTYLPNNNEGHDGDLQIIDINGKGTFLCIKSKGEWKISSKFNRKNKFDTHVFEQIKTNKIYGKSGLIATIATESLTSSTFVGKTGSITTSLSPVLRVGSGSNPGILTSNSNQDLILKTGNSTTSKFVMKDGENGDIITTINGTGVFDVVWNSTSASSGEFALLNQGNNANSAVHTNHQVSHTDADAYSRFSFLHDTASSNIHWVAGMDGSADSSSSMYKINYATQEAAITPSSGTNVLSISKEGHTSTAGTLTVGSVAEIGSDTDKILMSDSGVVKYVTGANLRSYIGAGTSSVAALNDLSDVTYSSGDLTISSLDTIISGALLFDASGDIEFESEGRVQIDKNIDNTSGGIQNALYVDLDRTGSVSTGIDDTTAVNINSRVTGASGGTITNTGLLVTAIGDSGGSSTTNGLQVLANSADTNNGIYINAADGVGNDFKNVSSADTGDFFSINTSANGATTLATIDDDASAGHLTLDADGQIIIDSVNSSGAITDGTLFKTDGTTFGSITTHHALSCFTLFEAGGSSTDDYLEIQVDAAGATSINTVDAGGATAHLTLNPDGNVFVSGADLTLDATKKVGFDGSGGHTYVHEEADDFVNFVVGGQGLMAIQEKAGTSVAQSSKIYTGCPLMLKDIGGVADNPVTGYGSVYVNSDTLYFKDDGGSTYNVHRGGKWQKTCGGYKTNNTSTSNYYYQYYVNYHSWSASDSSPTTLGSSGTPAKDYVWKAPAAGTLTNIYVSARTYDTGYDDPFKFYVFKGTPADGDQNVSLTQIGVTGAIQASVTNRINIVSTDITSSNTFNAGECLWVMLKKDSSSGNLDAYFNVTIKGDFT